MNFYWRRDGPSMPPRPAVRRGESPMLSEFTPFLVPLPLVTAAAAAFLAAGRRPRHSYWFAAAGALGALVAACVAAVALLLDGPATGSLAGGPLGWLSVRLDAVSAVMLLLVAFVGWVVLRYTRTYLDGEARQGPFTGWLCLTLACVMLLVAAGNLFQLLAAWVATSLSLHRLLLFYPDRAAARRAARKKYLVARTGDIALAGAVALLLGAYDTADIATILAAARAGEGGTVAGGAAALLAVAAVLKSAQFPTHGWLTEVMETPTPVSALLHAGVINAGGLLLIRFADVMLLAPVVLGALVVVGAGTALIGGLVMLTQPAVKTSLAWSTVAQMGFMILECGLGLFSLALLHIVAHSLYKAHAFLASGGAVERVVALRRPGPAAAPGVGTVALAFAVAAAVYAIVTYALGSTAKSPQSIALGAILVFGVADLLAQGWAGLGPHRLAPRMLAWAAATSLSYFLLQAAAVRLTAGTLPAAPAPGPLEWLLMAATVLAFGAVATAQALLPRWRAHPAAVRLRVHLSNGLYANAVFDRLTGGWSTRRRLTTETER